MVFGIDSPSLLEFASRCGQIHRWDCCFGLSGTGTTLLGELIRSLCSLFFLDDQFHMHGFILANEMNGQRSFGSSHSPFPLEWPLDGAAVDMGDDVTGL